MQFDRQDLCWKTRHEGRERRAVRSRHGGDPGRKGRNLLNGDELPPKVSVDLEPGDVLTIETPGGGGWGTQPDRGLVRMDQEGALP